MKLYETTWQTVGPFFSIGMAHMNTNDLAMPDEEGKHICIEGRILDGNGRAIPDAILEIWQANAAGEYAVGRLSHQPSQDSPFHGFGRIPTDAEGRFRFTTIEPGRALFAEDVLQAPHLMVRIMMRGLLKALVTRMYFPMDILSLDPVLQLVPEHRRGTLIAEVLSSEDATFVWDIHMQGEQETVFFDC